ncbi:hypothetical protein MXEN_19880 [Mycobacterium xenopi RIVM700367]|nr:hypothetical protein MXEN_19880 [Mycobacterium xenopi RIVM700367]
MPVFARQLLGIGRLPDDLRAEVEAREYLADYLAVTRQVSGITAQAGRSQRRPTGCHRAGQHLAVSTMAV